MPLEELPRQFRGAPVDVAVEVDPVLAVDEIAHRVGRGMRQRPIGVEQRRQDVAFVLEVPPDAAALTDVERIVIRAVGVVEAATEVRPVRDADRPVRAQVLLREVVRVVPEQAVLSEAPRPRP